MNDYWISETEGEIRSEKHMLNFIKMNLKASKKRLKEYKNKSKQDKMGE